MSNDANLLRRAADKIRKTARAANTDEARTPYGDRTIAPVTPEQWGDLLDGYLGGAIGAHAALWNPGIAELVAAWLEHSANEAEDPQEPPYINPRWPGFVLARAILGEPS